MLVLLGAGLLFTPLYLKRQIEAQSLSRDFTTEPVKVDLNNFNSLSSYDLPQRITIPDLGIDLPVKLSPIQNGYWTVWEDMAGFGEGSASPGTVGNTVIFAHARKGLFGDLKKALKNMPITVSTPSSTYTYFITDIKTVLPHEIEVIAPTDDQTLTLYTCSGFLDKKRLIVTAKPRP